MSLSTSIAPSEVFMPERARMYALSFETTINTSRGTSLLLSATGPGRGPPLSTMRRCGGCGVPTWSFARSSLLGFSLLGLLALELLARRCGLLLGPGLAMAHGRHVRLEARQRAERESVRLRLQVETLHT